MYIDKKNHRILLRDGTSLMESYEISRLVAKGESIEHCRALEDDYDALLYEEYHHKKIRIQEVDIDATYTAPEQTEEEVDILLCLVLNSPRFIRDKHYDRTEEELEYFVRTNNVKFVLRIKDLIDKLKNDNVIWGVGRGSSCASLVMFLLEVTDIDPTIYDIPFYEFSKEM